MECLQENSQHVELFWRPFNRAFKEVNKTEKIFEPNGWVTDMAGSNFVGLEKLYSEGVTGKIKGCEFHYKDSVNKKARSLGEDDEEFELMAINLLESSAPEAYEKVKDKMIAFINKKENLNTFIAWFNWWDARCNLTYLKPFKVYSNHRII